MKGPPGDTEFASAAAEQGPKMALPTQITDAQPEDVDSKETRVREQLALALLQHPTIEKAAASIGISAVTAWRMRRTAEFQKVFRQVRADAVGQSMERLQQGCGAAVTVLLKMMADTKVPPATRLKAADRVLQYAKSHFEWEDFENRLRRLEQFVTERQRKERGESYETGPETF